MTRPQVNGQGPPAARSSSAVLGPAPADAVLVFGLLQGQVGPVDCLPQTGDSVGPRARTRCRVLTTSAPSSSAAACAAPYSAIAATAVTFVLAALFDTLALRRQVRRTHRPSIEPVVPPRAPHRPRTANHRTSVHS